MRYGQTQIGFFIPDEMYEAVMKKVHNATYDRTMSACMRALIKKWLDGGVELTVDDVKPPYSDGLGRFQVRR